MEVKFLLKSGDALKPELVVPMLIARNPRVPEEPIIGYNVIEEIVKCGMETYPAVVTRALSEALSIDCKQIEALTQLLQTHNTDTREGFIRRRHVVIPAGKTKEVKCGVRASPLSTKQDVLFRAGWEPQVARWF